MENKNQENNKSEVLNEATRKGINTAEGIAEEIVSKGVNSAANVAGKVAKAGARHLLLPIIIIIAIIVIAGGIFSGIKLGWLHKPLSIDKTANTIDEIKKIGEFTTSCYYEEMALRDFRIDTVEKSSFMGFGGGEKYTENEIVLVGKGRVRAGFDLSKVENDGINVHGDTMELNLPPAKVFDIIMNPSDFTTEYESGTWSHELTKPLKERAIKQLEQNAIDYGIVEKAEESGLKRLESLFKTFGFNTVLITINHPEQSSTVTTEVIDTTGEAQ